MEQPLKEEIEKVIDEALDYTLKISDLKEIIVTTSGKDVLIRNYTHNRFLNRQEVIDGKIGVDIIYPYNPLKDSKKGRYVLYVDKVLEINRLKDF